jgi:hypothetical protein
MNVLCQLHENDITLRDVNGIIQPVAAHSCHSYCDHGRIGGEVGCIPLSGEDGSFYSLYYGGKTFITQDKFLKELS